ncbi:MAG: xanthine dehydrogenase family protein subunit M, partial [Candidatus Rokubacteria bacterium]|nr:xanthine dehydrogenase family protein subunit M [Candidatus Rokubacteria bacterium]
MSFEYHEPTSIADAVALGARFGEAGRFLAGGTDLIIQMRRGRVAPRHLLSLHRVTGLDRIEVDGAVRLGALVTHRAIEQCPHFQGPLGALVEGAEVIGGHQIRNVATVGGNVVNASPAADVVPVLLALNATVTCLGPDGERTLPLGGFLSGPGQTARRPGELLTSIRFDRLPPRSATAFLKAGRRKAMEIAVVCVAVRLTLDAARARCQEARIALGAVAPTTMRAGAAERALEGQPLTDEI